MLLNLINVDFSAIDQTAVNIVLVGISIVFSALITIYIFFKYLIPLFLRMVIKGKSYLMGKARVNGDISDIQGDVSAAIAVALYLHFSEIHDEESNVMTIKRVSRTYSPWSSKLYNMRNLK
jgi:hypothetical protein